MGKKQENNNDTINAHTPTQSAVRGVCVWTVGDNQTSLREQTWGGQKNSTIINTTADLDGIKIDVSGGSG